MKLFRILIPAMLAVAAVVTHLPGLTRRTAPDLFQQSALSPLVHAEALLARGRTEEALAAFKLAGARAFRESQKGVFERVRLRIGAAGKDLATRNPDKAWPFLAWYCLNVQDFTRSSAIVETWMLERDLSKGRFEYALMEPDGRKTIWGARATGVLTPLILRESGQRVSGFRILAEAIPGGTAETGLGGRRAYPFDLNMGFSFGTFPLQLCIRPTRASPHRWFLRVNSVMEWQRPIAPDGPNGGMYTFKVEELWSFNRIVVVGDEEPPPFQAVLIHTYEVL